MGDRGLEQRWWGRGPGWVHGILERGLGAQEVLVAKLSQIELSVPLVGLDELCVSTPLFLHTYL